MDFEADPVCWPENEALPELSRLGCNEQLPGPALRFAGRLGDPGSSPAESHQTSSRSIG